ncbi:MAG: DUF429 domain-containing protein [Armatimonadetes bacterium]|nr:DUF429 domain-containing protein [Armatimonadota bacterium]MDW8121393.1 DUF429 domain-containing protein [Armatimonadota bacterium]
MPKEQTQQSQPLIGSESFPVVGIDLSADESRPSGICLLKGRRAKTTLVRTDEEIVGAVRQWNPTLVAIDAPLTRPPGRRRMEEAGPYHLRSCDRALLRRRISFFPITLGGMRKLTERGIRLRRRLQRLGFHVIEVYPGGAQDLLGLPRKQKDLDGLREGLRRIGIQGLSAKANHDELDAATAALVGYLFLSGKAKVLGSKRQGAIVMPSPQVAYPDLFVSGLKLYWSGYYWHSHEKFEELWRESQGAKAAFLKALIQLNAAFIHAERREWRGVANLLGRVASYLSQCPDRMMGLSVRELMKTVRRLRQAAEELLMGKRKRFPWSLKPRLVPLGLLGPSGWRLRRAKDDLPRRNG